MAIKKIKVPKKKGPLNKNNPYAKSIKIKKEIRQIAENLFNWQYGASYPSCYPRLNIGTGFDKTAFEAGLCLGLILSEQNPNIKLFKFSDEKN